jgi:hypothetical protein
MSNSSKKDGAGGGIPITSKNTGSATGFKGLKPRDSTRDIDDPEDKDLSQTPRLVGTSPLESWINGYDNQKAASGRGTPPIASAYRRLTAVPASPSKLPTYDLPTTGATEKISPKVAPQVSSTSSPFTTGSGLSSSSQSTSPLHNQPIYQPPPLRFGKPLGTPLYKPAPTSFLDAPSLLSSSSPSPGPSASTTRLNPMPPYAPPGKRQSPSSFIEPLRSQPASPHTPSTNTIDPGPKLVESSSKPLTPMNDPASSSTSQPKLPVQLCWVPVNTWDSKSLTRSWTHDLVRTAIMRIMSEIDFDFYEDNYRFLDFDGSEQIVHKLWEVIKLVYTEFIKSYVYGIDILTLIAMHDQAVNGGPLANINTVLADMICFFAAGKIGMEKRAEDMAKALILGSK